MQHARHTSHVPIKTLAARKSYPSSRRPPCSPSRLRQTAHATHHRHPELIYIGSVRAWTASIAAHGGILRISWNAAITLCSPNPRVATGAAVSEGVLSESDDKIHAFLQAERTCGAGPPARLLADTAPLPPTRFLADSAPL